MAEVLEVVVFVFDLVSDALWFFVLRRERRWDTEPKRWKRLSEARRQRLRDRRMNWRERRAAKQKRKGARIAAAKARRRLGV